MTESEGFNNNFAARRFSSDLPWRLVFLCIGIIATLIGAWTTHSVSKEDLQAALAGQSAIIGQRQAAMEAQQASIAVQFEKLDELRQDMTKVKMALGIDEQTPVKKRRTR